MSVCVFVLFGRCHCTDYDKQNTGKCQASTTPQIQTYCDDRHKSALAFSQRGTYYYRVAQSQTLHAFAFSVFLLTSSYSCCFMHVGCRDIPCSVTWTSSLPFFDLSSPQQITFLGGLWSALSKIMFLLRSVTTGGIDLTPFTL